MNEFIPKELPLEIDFETVPILKKTISANKALAKLNGIYKKEVKFGRNKYFRNIMLYSLLKRGGIK